MTPNKALANYSSYTNSSVIDGLSATLQCTVILSKATDWNSEELNIFTLPEEARPSESRNLYRCCLVFASGGKMYLRGVRVDADGKVVFLNSDGGTKEVTCAALIGVEYRL